MPTPTSEAVPAFRLFGNAKIDDLILVADTCYQGETKLLHFSSHHSISTIYYNVVYAVAGALIVSGTDEVEKVRLAFVYVGKILQGAKPAEMPVQRPVKFRPIVNLKAVRELRLTVPQSRLAGADGIIELSIGMRPFFLKHELILCMVPVCAQ